MQDIYRIRLIRVSPRFVRSCTLRDFGASIPLKILFSAIEFVLLVVKSHGCLLISCVGVNDVVSITYTAETKGATSSDIFPVENGPIEMLVRAGLLFFMIAPPPRWVSI